MGKLPDLDAFERGPILGAGRMGHSISSCYTSCLGKRALGLEGRGLKTSSMYNGVFQQDNCTSHKSRLATGWLEEHSSDFSVINWPPRNPDLNPIDIFGMF
ncbi:uncharacterized protein TNCV_1663941 [Trichonephila clavipes]|uniref:Tc1-like transposase DDE domain-containing protein n=1 Tax=Trichonephila clavipes TaxID=2585209 RepID=A0A8X6RX01_TRICX|nr:uncharacterized protein TNCV_1663941 [Trichonephila clavipes]